MIRVSVFLMAILALAAPAPVPIARYGHDGPAILPDARVTPGAIRTTDLRLLCPHANTKAVRNVPESEKREVYAEYGARDVRGADEVDHLISLELGGSNDIRNLWPEPYRPVPGAHEKDRVENYLHAQVCAGKISLNVAQQSIRTDWYKIYQRMPK